jgi:exosortase/archaeosortase family protein
MMALTIASPTTFVIKAITLSLGIFGVLRLPPVEQTVVQALINLQLAIAGWYGAPSTLNVLVNPSCSAVDVISLSLGITLAYPAAWRMRIAGAAGGLLTILVLNTMRIGTLLSVADSIPQRVPLLHEYIWPAILVASILFYIWFWTRMVDRVHADENPGASGAMRRRMPRFVASATGLLAVYSLTAPWTMTSTMLVAAGAWVAGAARVLAGTVGVEAAAQGTVLSTSRGAFEVTPECLLTPMLPIYLAAAFTVATGRRRLFWLAAAVPLLFVLSVLRLLVLALPQYLVASPLMLAHGFFQLVAAAAVIAAACAQPSTSTGVASAWRSHPVLRWVIAAAGGVFAGTLAGDALSVAVSSGAALTLTVFPHALTAFTQAGDVQGALQFMPAYQLGLLSGLWIALTGGRQWGGLLWTVLALCASQVLWLVVVGEWAAHAGAMPHALVLRAWNVAVPTGFGLLAFRQRNGESDDDDASYRNFWQRVGRDFPDLAGARSTDYYFRSEVRLLTEHLPNLKGCRLLKTDLWDEAKNTRILCWAAAHGARVYGVDISKPIVQQAHASFDQTRPRLSLGDVRSLPFVDNSFDAIYSMGTIEHFDESETAVTEMARVLKPGGRLVLGVPNRHDPFLRPLLVWLLSAVGLYAYGFEKSYSRRQLNRMLDRSGLVPVVSTGILFIPGWLRMADLALHVWCRPLTRLAGPAIGLFEWLDDRFPSVRHHGYLVVSVALKPGMRTSSDGAVRLPLSHEPCIVELCTKEGSR